MLPAGWGRGCGDIQEGLQPTPRPGPLSILSGVSGGSHALKLGLRALLYRTPFLLFPTLPPLASWESPTPIPGGLREVALPGFLASGPS